MSQSRRLIATLIFSILTLTVVTTASAKESAKPELYETNVTEVPFVVADSNGGFLFIDQQLQPLRAYAWKANKASEFGQPYFIADLDGDKRPEFVGAGKPTFVIKANGDALWSDSKGCDQVLVGDFAADEKLDIACIRGTSIKLVTFDNQMVWELQAGRRLDSCRAEDLNGDQKLELECKVKGKSNYLRVDGTNGSVIAADSNEAKVEKEFKPYINSLTGGSLPTGVTPPKGELIAVVTKDFNADKKSDTLILTDQTIFSAPSGGEPKSYKIEAKKYKRVPVATLKSADVNNFADIEAAKAKAEALAAPLSKCYASAVKKSPFAGSGQILVRAEVDEKGKVTSVQKLHSSMADKKIDSCVMKVMKKGDFTNAPEGQKGSVNLTIVYSFKSE